MLSAKLTYLRKKAGKTQKEVADYLGITRPAYTAYESGKRQPDYETLIKLTTLFSVSSDYLLGISNKPEKPKPFIDLDAPLREKNRADALLKISELDSEFNLPDEVILSLIKKVREKYGPLPREGGIAAHGPEQPGTGALRKEDFE